MVADDTAHPVKRAQLSTQAVADERVLLHRLVFRGGQRSGFEENRVGHPNLAQVVHETAAAQHREIVVGEAESATKHHGRGRKTLAVSVRVGVSRLDGQRQAHDHIVSPIEFVGKTFDPHERSEAGADLLAMQRLGHEVVGTRFDGLETIGGVVGRRHEHHRNETCYRLAFQLPADAEAIVTRHSHVHENRVRLLRQHGMNGMFRVVAGADFKAVGTKPPGNQTQVRREVVEDKDATESIR